MTFKKILAGTVAAALAVGSMAVCSSAATDFTWELAGQFDSDFNEAEEWPAGVTGSGTTGEEVTAVWEFDDNVKLATNYFGFKTEGVVWNAEGENATVEVTSFKVDGREVAVDNEKLNSNRSDNDSASGNLKFVFYNEWDVNCQGNYAIDVAEVNGDEGFTKLEITFKIVEPSSTDDGDNTVDNDDDTADDTDPAGDVDAPTADKNSPDTGVEGVAIVAGLAVIAAGAVVVAKKRK